MKRVTEVRAGSIEEEFQRFRRGGDVEALGRVFERTSPRLLGLAGRLAGDASEAEDLVQAAFLKALIDRDRWDEQRPLLPWLGGILAHRARDIGRRRSVRRTSPLHDDAHSGQAGDDPAALAAFADDQRVLLEAVGKLGEPYSELLAMRIENGLDTSDLATALGRSAATIRVQLSRGRERLEALLPKELGLSALLILTPNGALDRLRGQMFSDWARVGGAAELSAKAAASKTVLHKAAAGAATSWSGGKLALLSAVALLALAVVWRSANVKSAQSPVEPFPAASSPSGGSEAPDLMAVGSSSSRSDRVASAAVGTLAAPKPPSLRVRVSSTSVATGSSTESTEAPSVGVYIRQVGQQALGLAGVTGPSGDVTFEGLTSGRYEVKLGPSSAPPTIITVLGPRTLQLVLPDGVDIEGRVLAFDGSSVGGADVYRVDAFHDDATQWLATTDASGNFFAADVAPGSELFARAAGHQPTGGKRFGSRGRVRGTAGSSQSFELQLGARGFSVEGRVLEQNGQPSPHALVVIAVDEDARESVDGVAPRQSIDIDSRSGERRPQDTDSFIVRADADGVFRSEEVPRGTAVLFARSFEDPSQVGSALVDVQGTGLSQANVRLSPGAEVFGRVMDTSGKARAGVHVQAKWQGSPELGQFESGFGEEAFRGQAVSAPDGRYRITGLLPGRTSVQIPNSEGRTLLRETVDLKSSYEWNPVVPIHSDLRVRALGRDGAPLVGWQVTYAYDQHNLRRPDGRLTDDEGRIHFRGMEGHEVTVALHAPKKQWAQSERIPFAHTQARPSEEEIVLVHDPSVACKVSGSVTWPETLQGDHERHPQVQLILEGFDELGQQALDDDGGFHFDPVPPGRYRLVVPSPVAGVASGQELAAFHLEPGQSLDLGELTPPLGTTLLLDLGLPESLKQDDPEVRVRRAADLSLGNHGVQLKRSAPGARLVSEPLLPGRYIVVLWSTGTPIDYKLVEILPGMGEHLVTWNVDAGEPVDLQIHFDRDPTIEKVRPRCSAGEGRVDLSLYDDAGHRLWYQRITRPYDTGDRRVLTVSRPMAPGTYSVVIEDERFDGWDKPWTALDFLVAPGAKNQWTIRLNEPWRPSPR